MILNDHITYEKNLSNLSLADRRGNNTRTSVRQVTTGRPIPCSVQSRKGAILPSSQRPARPFSRRVVGETQKGSALTSLLGGSYRDRQSGAGTDGSLSSHTRARVAATRANRPQLQHVPRGCFLKMAADLRYSLPKAGVDVGSQRPGNLMVEQSTEGG